MEAGSRLAVLGPAGAGTTTLLRAIAGLERAAAGTVRLDGVDVTRQRARRRSVGVVFRRPHLFPNMDLLENVAFPLRAAGVRGEARRGEARRLLDELGLGALEGRELGGLTAVEQRRVALARALCGGPRLLLIDEPTAGVDAERRDGLRALILRAQREWRITTIVATHEPAEAAELGERLALMIEGRVIQHDGPERVFLEPASPAVARFLGSRNLLGGEARDGQIDTDAGVLAVPGPDGPADFTIRPERVRLRPDGHLRMRVDEAAFVGSGVRVRLSAGELRLEALVDPAEAPPAGEIVRVDCPLDALWRFPQPAAGLARPPAAGAYST